MVLQGDAHYVRGRIAASLRETYLLHLYINGHYKIGLTVGKVQGTEQLS